MMTGDGLGSLMPKDVSLVNDVGVDVDGNLVDDLLDLGDGVLGEGKLAVEATKNPWKTTVSEMISQELF